MNTSHDKSAHQTAFNTHASNLVALDRWRDEIGKTSATIWRWRRRGWIDVQNISGRLYASREAIAEFERRAAAGEFAREHKTPVKGKPSGETATEGNSAVAAKKITTGHATTLSRLSRH